MQQADRDGIGVLAAVVQCEVGGLGGSRVAAPVDGGDRFAIAHDLCAANAVCRKHVHVVGKSEPGRPPVGGIVIPVHEIDADAFLGESRHLLAEP